MSEPAGIHLHEDLPLFREAINFTVSRTGFNARLIEKDYFCTALLAHLVGVGCDGLVFKGGTCLAKVHAGFYRLSEDLDFTIPLPVEAGRKTRRKAVAELKKAVDDIGDHITVFTAVEPLHGANDSSQYKGAVGYRSPTTGLRETILVEVSVREPLLMPADPMLTRTLLLDPVSGQAAMQPLQVNCITLKEISAGPAGLAVQRGSPSRVRVRAEALAGPCGW